MTLHQEFIDLARQKRRITYQLVALLPKIYKQGLYKKYAKTIQGYAWQFAQIPESTVNKALKLDIKLSDRPLLKQAILKVGVHKVSAIESLVTPENESIFVEKIQNMSKSALNELSKELRQSETYKTITLSLPPDLQKLWNTAKKMLECSNDSDLQFMQKMLENVVSFKSETEDNKITKQSSRHIPTKTKKASFKKYDNKCSYPSCTKNAKHLHHQERYAKVRNHNRLLPLCKNHHEFAHNTLIKNENNDPIYWELHPTKTTNSIDLKYLKFRS